MGCTWSSRLRRAFVGFTSRHVESHDFRCQIDLYSSRRMDPNVEWIMAVMGGQFFFCLSPQWMRGGFVERLS